MKQRTYGDGPGRWRMVLAMAVLLVSAAVSPAPPAKTVPKAAVAKAGAAKGGVDLDFDSAKYDERNFPGYCVTFAVFRNEKKKRPLFSIGRGAGGAFNVPFDVSDLTDKDEPDNGTGEAKLALEFRDDKRGHMCFFRGEDWDAYACGQWTQTDKPPTVEVTLSNLRDWKAKDKLMRKFMNPDRKRPPPGTTEPPLEPCFSAKLDLTMRVGNSRAEIKDLPCEVRFSDAESYWGVLFVMKFSFQGVDLGLVGDDAGPISMMLVTQAFCRPPKAHRAPTLDLDDKGAPALTIPD